MADGDAENQGGSGAGEGAPPGAPPPASNSRIRGIIPHQFKPGQSGNPAGRPKGKSLLAAIDEALDELVEVTIGGVKKTIPARDALARRIVKRMLDGDNRALESWLSRKEPQLRRVEMVGGGVGGPAPDRIVRMPAGGLAELGPETGEQPQEHADDTGAGQAGGGGVVGDAEDPGGPARERDG